MENYTICMREWVRDKSSEKRVIGIEEIEKKAHKKSSVR